MLLNKLHVTSFFHRKKILNDNAYIGIIFLLAFLILLQGCVAKDVTYIHQAWSKERKGDYDGAIADYTKAIELKPDDVWGYSGRGYAKIEKGDYDGAIADYTKIIELKPDDTIGYEKRSRAKIKKGDYDGAIADLTKVIELKPDDADGYYRRGLIKHTEIDDYNGAIKDYNKAIELFPDYGDAYYFRSYAKISKGDYDGAIADFTKMMEWRPWDAENYYCRGVAKHNKGDYNGAIADYTKAIELKPDDANLYWNRGKTYDSMKYFERAIKDYRKVLDIDPDHKYAKADLKNLITVLNSNPEYLKKTQVMLGKLGYYRGDIDGESSQTTKKAINEFQKNNRLKNTGEIDIDSQSLLVKTYEKSVNKKLSVSPRTNEFQINFPPDGYETKESFLLLDAIFSGNAEIESITVKINNQKLKSQSDPDYNPKHTAANIDWEVPLSEGKNDINFVVFTREGVFKKKITVVQKPERGLVQKRGKKWAVVIGIENYDDRKMTDLDFTVDDAEDFTRVLIEKGKFSPNNIILLTDKKQKMFTGVIRKQPTFDNIKRALFTTLRKKTSKRDWVIIYYSGHGVLVPDPTAIPKGRTAYLAPKDFEYDAPEVKGIRLDDIKRLAYLAPERMFLIIDSCFSGGGEENVKTIAGFKMKAGGSSELTSGFGGKGRVLMVSSLDNQVSLESESLENSVFTYYLVDILGRGERRLSEIFEYVHSNVRTHTNGNQEPRLDTLEQKGKIFLY
jgi:tetratricopeptide (TPR) repeat protein